MEDRMATEQDAVREWAYNFGATCPEKEWLASNYDTWERNPHFTGTPGRYPEDSEDGD